MIPQHYPLAIDFPGTLYICPRPRGNDWLREELEGFKKMGVVALISLLTEDEETLLGLEKEKEVCEELGIEFVNLPIEDRSLPLTHKDFLGEALGVLQRLKSGGNAAVHCRAGIGRSSLFSAAVLYFHGIFPEESLEIIAAARGFAVPDTDAQKDWIMGLEKWAEGFTDWTLDLSGLPG